MMAAQSTTTAFALGVLALGPGGGSTTSRGGGDGSGGGSSGGGMGMGVADAFVGQVAIRPLRGAARAARSTGSGCRGFLGVPSESTVNSAAWTGSNRAAFSRPPATMTLKTGPRPPTSSSSSSSSSDGGGGGGDSKREGGGSGRVKRRVARTNGFGHCNEDFKYVAAIKGGVIGYLEAMDQSLSGELVTVVTYLPWCRSCHHLRHRLRVLAEAHAIAGSGAMFYEIDLHANPEVHKMLDIHATPTVLLYSSGQLVDEFTCAGDSGPRVMLKHIEEQVGSIPDPWHRLPETGPPPESPTPGVWREGEEDYEEG